MNKRNKILLNNKSRNHIKFMCLPASAWDLPDNDKDQLLWCQARFIELVNSDTAHREYIKTNSKQGYSIGVWVDNGVNYLVQSIRNEFKTYNNTVYMLKGELSDAVNMAKFLTANAQTLMQDYKQQIIDAGEDYKQRSSGADDNKENDK